VVMCPIIKDGLTFVNIAQLLKKCVDRVAGVVVICLRPREPS
jgi:hypothetical protein